MINPDAPCFGRRKKEEDLCSMDVVSCPLYEKAKELGTPQAVQMICCMDKEYMNGFRGIDYTRTKSVAEGDDCCDYRLRDSRDRFVPTSVGTNRTGLGRRAYPPSGGFFPALLKRGKRHKKMTGAEKLMAKKSDQNAIRKR